MTKGIRLDELLVARGLFPTRAKAKAAVMAGLIYVDGRRVDKAGALCRPDAQIEVRGPVNPYVSRGGLKLQHALDVFGVPVEGRTCIDVGASTGGFTDCLLQRGAAKVYAVDVGYGQLHWKLRQDPRVVAVERTNFRYIQPGDLPAVDLVVVDVSFISLLKMLPAVRCTLRPEGDVVALIKPQFEAGREAVGKGSGVVRDARIHRQVIETVLGEAARDGWIAMGLTYSPILGPKGNIEFFVWWRQDPQSAPGRVDAAAVAGVVEEAHRLLLASSR